MHTAFHGERLVERYVRPMQLLERLEPKRMSADNGQARSGSLTLAPPGRGFSSSLSRRALLAGSLRDGECRVLWPAGQVVIDRETSRLRPEALGARPAALTPLPCLACVACSAASFHAGVGRCSMRLWPQTGAVSVAEVERERARVTLCAGGALAFAAGWGVAAFRAAEAGGRVIKALRCRHGYAMLAALTATLAVTLAARSFRSPSGLQQEQRQAAARSSHHR